MRFDNSRCLALILLLAAAFPLPSADCQAANLQEGKPPRSDFAIRRAIASKQHTTRAFHLVQHYSDAFGPNAGRNPYAYNRGRYPFGSYQGRYPLGFYLGGYRYPFSYPYYDYNYRPRYEPAYHGGYGMNNLSDPLTYAASAGGGLGSPFFMYGGPAYGAAQLAPPTPGPFGYPPLIPEDYAYPRPDPFDPFAPVGPNYGLGNLPFGYSGPDGW